MQESIRGFLFYCCDMERAVQLVQLRNGRCAETVSGPDCHRRTGEKEVLEVSDMKNLLKWHNFWACLMVISIFGAIVTGHTMISGHHDEE